MSPAVPSSNKPGPVPPIAPPIPEDTFPWNVLPSCSPSQSVDFFTPSTASFTVIIAPIIPPATPAKAPAVVADTPLRTVFNPAIFPAGFVKISKRGSPTEGRASDKLKIPLLKAVLIVPPKDDVILPSDDNPLLRIVLPSLRPVINLPQPPSPSQLINLPT